ncbi:hypothetical protein ACFYZ3_19450 [Streptomyces sp. NPDC001599]|uniref:hypothetical protein n=1 Tax=Streptomyces sp. NPDC001599 TaxID=3364591 RepID=UPI00367E96F6
MRTVDILVTVIVLLAVIAAGAFLIHRLNSQHGDRSAAFHYGRGGVVAPDRKTDEGSAVRRRASAARDAGERRGRGGGGRGRLRPRRRTHGVSAR